MIAEGFLETISNSPLFLKIGPIALVVTLISVTWIIASAWRRVRESEHRAHLTGMMLQRGMSAVEIAKVLWAGRIAGDEESSEEEEEEETDPEVQVVTALTEQGYSGADVERALVAAREDGRISEPTVRLVKTLAENWTEADDIERILEARKARSHVQVPAKQSA